MNEWMQERNNEWMNICKKGRKKEIMEQRTNERKNKLVNEWMNEWMNE
jgi:hypothetical protein